MKRYLSYAAIGLLLVTALLVRTFKVYGQVPGPQGPMMFAATCIGTTNFGGAALCYDTGLHTFNYWNGTTFTVIANAAAVFTSPLQLNGTSSGNIKITSGATPTTYTLTLPSAAPTSSGKIMSFTTAGVGSFISYPFTIAMQGDLGTITNAATATIVAPCAGHFTSLSINPLLTGTCTTPPQFNVTNVSGSTNGTGATAGVTVGTPVTQAQTLVFTAAQVIGISQTATPSSCTVPRFAVIATAVCP